MVDYHDIRHDDYTTPPPSPPFHPRPGMVESAGSSALVAEQIDQSDESTVPRGLLDAPASFSGAAAAAAAAAFAASTPAAQPLHPTSATALQDNLLGDEDESGGVVVSEGVGGQALEAAASHEEDRLVSEMVRGARLRVDDVTVVTPTGKCATVRTVSTVHHVY